MPDKLPKHWVNTTLGQVCAINPRPMFEELPSEKTEVSFVPMAAVEEETGRLDASDFRALSAVRKGYTPFREKDVIFAKITPCMENGKIALATGLKNGLGYGSTEFFVLRPYEGLLPRFVLHFLLQPSFRHEAERRMTGVVGQKRVPANYLSMHRFPLPPTREQERIVAKLDASLARLAAGEAAARRALDRLQRYRAAVLHAAVTGELTREWRKTHKPDETGVQLLRRLLEARRTRWEQSGLRRLGVRGKPPKDDKWKSRYPEPRLATTGDLQDLPEGWLWASVDQLASGETGAIQSGPFGSQLLHSEFVKRGVLAIGIDNVLDGVFSMGRQHRITRSKYKQLQKFTARPLDVVITVMATVGRVCVLPKRLETAIITKHCYRISPSAGFVNSHYLAFTLRADAPTRRHIFGNIRGQTRPGINGSILKVAPVPLPPISEQTEIVREVEHRLAAADRLAVTIHRQLDRTSATRESLLREAFSGKFVPQGATEESASVLLDRIRTERAAEAEARRVKRSRKESRSQKKEEVVAMVQTVPTADGLRDAWKKLAKKPDARRLFELAGFTQEQVVAFYEVLRATPEIRHAFESASREKLRVQKTAVRAKAVEEKTQGRFRLVTLWLENFKNLENYEVHFEPDHGLDIVLGWNGTGKSNLFEALLIIFRDLHQWWEKNRWPDEPMRAYRLVYEIENHLVEVTWNPEQMRRPEIKKADLPKEKSTRLEFLAVKREDLPLPRFIFGYYSGPTNRLAEHFLPMKRDHYERLRKANSDDPKTLARLLEQRRFFCAETHHAKYVLLAFSYKEDPKITRFLENRLRIVGFESALFVIRRPRWARKGSGPEDFWGATGIMLRVMEKLRRFAIAPMVVKQTVSDGYRSTTEDHYFFFLPDLKSLHAFAAEYPDARSFFVALESTDFSELIHDVKIQVRVKGTENSQIPITFRELSEGEQQLLMVLGLMRFTKAHESLVLLDEPDTHLNPHWSVDYLKDLASVISDDENPSPEQLSSQLLMATHDPLVIASLFKEQVHLLKRDRVTFRCYWEPASQNPRGLGFTGILTSEMFGFRSDLDPETLADLDNRVRLIAKEGERTPEEKKQLEEIDTRLSEAGFMKAFSDPYYAAFVRAWGRRFANQMAGKQFITGEEQEEVDRIAREVLAEAVEEVKKEVAG
jgi:restriction endonuclease S subunit